MDLLHCILQKGMPGYKLPSVTTMRNTIIPRVGFMTKEVVRRILEKCTCFTVIVDIWSSKNMQGYIGFGYIQFQIPKNYLYLFLSSTGIFEDKVSYLDFISTSKVI